MTMRVLEAKPAWTKKTVTTATFAASTAYRLVRATTLGRIAVGAQRVIGRSSRTAAP